MCMRNKDHLLRLLILECLVCQRKHSQWPPRRRERDLGTQARVDFRRRRRIAIAPPAAAAAAAVRETPYLTRAP